LLRFYYHIDPTKICETKRDRLVIEMEYVLLKVGILVKDEK